MQEQVREITPPTSSWPRGSFALAVLGLLSTLGYLYLFRLSFAGLGPSEPDHAAITHFLLVYAFLFAAYLLLVLPWVRRGGGMDQRLLWFGVAFGLLFRAIVLPSDLILENDIYRYMWDGHMQTEQVNPFRYAPDDPETEPYRTAYWDQINYPWVPTIYPPVLQYVFLFSELIYPGSVVGMKFVLILFDVAVIFLLLWVLPLYGRPPEWALIYAWSPLVIKEVANSGHADVVSAFLLVLLLGVAAKGRALASSLTLACLTLTKFFGVLLLPLFWRRFGWRHYAAFGGAIGLLYFPFLDWEINLFEGFLTYSRTWLFNAGVYELVVWFFDDVAQFTNRQAGLWARYGLFGVVCLVVGWQCLRLWKSQSPVDWAWAVFWVLGALLLCSPVINAWYLVWIVPLLCLFPSVAWLLLTGLVILAYTYYYDFTFAPWVKWTEYGIFFFVLLIEWLRSVSKKSPYESIKGGSPPSLEASPHD